MESGEKETERKWEGDRWRGIWGGGRGRESGREVVGKLIGPIEGERMLVSQAAGERQLSLSVLVVKKAEPLLQLAQGIVLQ